MRTKEFAGNLRALCECEMYKYSLLVYIVIYAHVLISKISSIEWIFLLLTNLIGTKTRKYRIFFFLLPFSWCCIGNHIYTNNTHVLINIRKRMDTKIRKKELTIQEIQCYGLEANFDFFFHFSFHVSFLRSLSITCSCSLQPI